MTHNKEKWRWITGFEGIYSVSNKGRVCSFIRKEPYILKYKPDKDGYVRIKLSGVKMAIHTLVLTAFVGPRPEGMEACHKNSKRDDNRWPENLRWDTRWNNRADSMPVLTYERVNCVLRMLKSGRTNRQIADEVTIGYGTVSTIRVLNRLGYL